MKLRYVAAGLVVELPVVTTVAALVLGMSPILWFLIGLGLGSVNAATVYLFRGKTPYEW